MTETHACTASASTQLHPDPVEADCQLQSGPPGRVAHLIVSRGSTCEEASQPRVNSAQGSGRTASS